MTQGGGKYISRNRSVITGELANCVPMRLIASLMEFTRLMRIQQQNPWPSSACGVDAERSSCIGGYAMPAAHEWSEEGFHEKHHVN